MNITTVARLRPVLETYFPAAHIDTVLRKVRKAGLIPAGEGGRNGARSASIDVSQVAAVIMALASRATFRGLPGDTLVYQFRLTRSEPLRFDRKPSIEMRNNLMAGIIEDIERAAAGQQPGDWTLSMSLSPAIGWDHPAAVIVTCRLPAGLITDIGRLSRADRDEAAA